MTEPFEFYETPIGMTEALIERVGNWIGPYDHVVDVCAGDGAILDYLRFQAPMARLSANDVDEKRAPVPATSHEDAAVFGGWINMFNHWGQWPDWTITNPPFSLAHKIIPQAVQYSVKGVAMLLPLRFMEPTAERAQVLRDHPWDASIIFGSPRPSFNGPGASTTDSVTTFWAIWVNEATKPKRLSFATGGRDRWYSLLATADGKIPQLDSLIIGGY